MNTPRPEVVPLPNNSDDGDAANLRHCLQETYECKHHKNRTHTMVEIQLGSQSLIPTRNKPKSKSDQNLIQIYIKQVQDTLNL